MPLKKMVGNLKDKIKEAEENSEKAMKVAQEANRAKEVAEQAKKDAEDKSEKLLETAATLEEVVFGLTSTADALQTQVLDVNNKMNEQKGRVEEAATAMQQMNATVLEVAKKCSSCL